MAIADEIFFDNKFTEMQRWPQQDQRNNVLYSGVVQTISPLNRVNGTVNVRVPDLHSILKCDASGPYSSYFVGETRDYYEGDHVLIAFVNGKSERPVVITTIPHHNCEAELLNDIIPTIGVESDVSGNPNLPSTAPQGTIPGAINNNFQVSGTVHRMRFGPDDPFHSNYHPIGAHWVDSLGNEFHYPSHTFAIKSTEIQHIVRAPAESTDPVLSPFAEANDKIKVLKVSEEMEYPLRLQPTFDYKWEEVDYPVGPKGTQLHFDFLIQKSQEVFPVKTPEMILEEAQVESDHAKFLLACIGQNVDESVSPFGQILGNLFGLDGPLVDAVLDMLNSVLPDFLQVGVEDGNIQVGPLAINTETGQIGFDGKVFGAALQKPLAELNSMLPDFLGVNITPDSIGLGDDIVYFDEMQGLGPGESRGVGPLDIVMGEDGGLRVMIGDSEVVNLTEIAVNQIGNVVDGPLSELNSQLPPGMGISYSFGANGAPVIKVGPLTLDLSNPEQMLSFNPMDLMEMLTQQLQNFVGGLLNQLPKPLQMLALALWEELNIGSLFSGLLESLGLPLEPKVITSTSYLSCAVSTDGTKLPIFDPTNGGPPPITNTSDYTVPTETISQFEFE
jgi:hypothetical protein